MKNIYTLKSELEDLMGLQDLTESLNYMSAAKMMKLKDQVLQNRAYLEEALQAKVELQRYIVYIDKGKPQAKVKKDGFLQKTLVMAFMSDQGLCGNFNSQLAKFMQKNLKGQEVDILIIGKRGQSYITDPKLKKHVKVIKIPNPEDTKALKEIFQIIASYDVVQLYYNKFINPVKTDPVSVFYKSLSDSEVAKKLTKVQINDDGDALEYMAKNMIVEPSVVEAERFFETVVAQAVFDHELLESQLSENNARMLAMKEANDNIVELVKKQKKDINQTRRKKINQALSELFGAMMLNS